MIKLKYYTEPEESLNVIEELVDEYTGEIMFTKEHVDIVRNIVRSLDIEPFVSPTNTGAIQIEWEKDNRYLEFEIFENRAELYAEIGHETYEEIYEDIIPEEINDIVNRIMK